MEIFGAKMFDMMRRSRGGKLARLEPRLQHGTAGFLGHVDKRLGRLEAMGKNTARELIRKKLLNGLRAPLADNLVEVGHLTPTE